MHFTGLGRGGLGTDACRDVHRVCYCECARRQTFASIPVDQDILGPSRDLVFDSTASLPHPTPVVPSGLWHARLCCKKRSPSSRRRLPGRTVPTMDNLGALVVCRGMLPNMSWIVLQISWVFAWSPWKCPGGVVADRQVLVKPRCALSRALNTSNDVRHTFLPCISYRVIRRWLDPLSQNKEQPLAA